MKLRGLRQARRRSGLSIGQLADATGLRRDVIGRLEHCQEEPQPYALRRLAAILGVSTDELLGSAPVVALTGSATQGIKQAPVEALV